jgi:hypothetical protein
MKKKRNVGVKMQGEKQRGGVGESYFVELKSKDLPFVVKGGKIGSLTKANRILQDFIRKLEKGFDTIWYIGVDYVGDELYERFMFHHGGFMEVSLRGEIRAYFVEDKIGKFRGALLKALEKFHGNKRGIAEKIKGGKMLINKKGVNKL